MTQRNSDHVIMDMVLARFECKHCGETLGLSLPMGLIQLNRLGAAFLDNHRACKRKEEP